MKKILHSSVLMRDAQMFHCDSAPRENTMLDATNAGTTKEDGTQYKQTETQTRKQQEKKRVAERKSGRRAVFGYICFMCGCDTALECIGPEYSSPGFGRNTGMFRSIAALIRQRCKPTRLPPVYISCYLLHWH